MKENKGFWLGGKAPLEEEVRLAEIRSNLPKQAIVFDSVIERQKQYLLRRPAMTEDHTKGKLISRTHDELRELHQASNEDFNEEWADVFLEGVANLLILTGLDTQAFLQVVLDKIEKNEQRFPEDKFQKGMSFSESYQPIKERERQTKGYAVYPLVNP